MTVGSKSEWTSHRTDFCEREWWNEPDFIVKKENDFYQRTRETNLLALFTVNTILSKLRIGKVHK